MHSKLVLTSGLVAAGFIAAACASGRGGGAGLYGSSPASPSAAPVVAASPSPVAPVASGTAINVGTTKVGQVLVDSSGQTVYLFLADNGATSSCNSTSCVQYWPPVMTNGAPQAGAGVNASLLGTITRGDQTIQLTYPAPPLYPFISDKMAADATAHGPNAIGAHCN